MKLNSLCPWQLTVLVSALVVVDVTRAASWDGLLSVRVARLGD